MSTSQADLGNFPYADLLPKNVTQQTDFLARFPTYDGRGVLIAILDSGVDVSCPGLQKTTTGLRKVVDCIDASGAGDVDTSHVVKASPGEQVSTLSGRNVTIPDSWKCPSREFHLGLKPLYELFDGPTLKRYKTERQTEEFEPDQQMALADAFNRLANDEKANGGTSASQADARQRDELAAHVDVLREWGKRTLNDDKGPLLDVFVWNDGEQWRAALDLSFRGKLQQATVLGEFRRTGDWSKLTDRDHMVYTVSVHDSGKLLEIVTTTSSHGTHVAHIAAGHVPGDPDKDGLAPGAQIVSITIGDQRCAGIETGLALSRAFSRCADLGVDIANMSYGESAPLCNYGELSKALDRLVHRHGTIFVSSAGNAGPALSTGGAPGSTTDAIIGIGAWVTRAMASTQYSVRRDITDDLFVFSARGPTLDGGWASSIVAPGSAHTGVSACRLRPAQQMAGTSMSSPNACGSIACLLSALKQKNISYSPLSVRRAVEATAGGCGDASEPYETGAGLLHINSAFDWLDKHNDWLPKELSAFRISITGGSTSTGGGGAVARRRGVYLREWDETREKHEFSATIEPFFAKPDTKDAQLGFDRAVRLVTTAPDWVQIPAQHMLNSSSAIVNFSVDPRNLKEDAVHYAEIRGFDASRPDAGVLYRIPVTVVKPTACVVDRRTPIDTSKAPAADWDWTGSVDLSAGRPTRHFLAVPSWAHLYEVRVRNTGADEGARFWIHCQQIAPFRSPSHGEKEQILQPGTTEWTLNAAAWPGRTLEVCTALAWNAPIATARLEISVRFRGLSLLQRPIHWSNAETYNELSVRNDSPRPEKLSPDVALDQLVVPIRPTDAQLRAQSGPRDLMFSEKQLLQLVLKYTFNVPEKVEVALDAGGLQRLLYDSPVNDVFVQLHTESKEYIGAAAAFPNRSTHKHTIDKGAYVALVAVRHTDEKLLNGLRDTPLNLKIKLPRTIRGTVVNSPTALVTPDVSSEKKVIGAQLRAGQTAHWFLRSPAGLADDKLLKELLTPGASLLGNLSLISLLDGSAPQQKVAVVYHIAEWGKRQSQAHSDVKPKLEPKTKKTQLEELEDKLRDLKVETLAGLKEPAAAEQLYTELAGTYASHLAVHTALLKQAQLDWTTVAANPERLLKAVDNVLGAAKPDEVQLYFGLKSTPDSEWSIEKADKKKEMEERRTAIIDALLAKANYLANAHLTVTTENVPRELRAPSCPKLQRIEKDDASSAKKSKDVETAKSSEEEKTESKSAAVVSLKELDDAVRQLLEWVDAKDVKVAGILAKAAVARNTPATGIQHIERLLDSLNGTSTEASQLRHTVAALLLHAGNVHLAVKLQSDLRRRTNARDFRPF